MRAELAELRASKSASFSLPTTGDVLSSLGLDKWKDDRLKGGKVGGHTSIHSKRTFVFTRLWSADDNSTHAI